MSLNELRPHFFAWLRKQKLSSTQELCRQFCHGPFSLQDTDFFEIIQDCAVGMVHECGISQHMPLDLVDEHHQDWLKQLTHRFLENRGSTYWPDDPEQANYGFLQYSTDFAVIRKIMIQIFYIKIIELCHSTTKKPIPKPRASLTKQDDEKPSFQESASRRNSRATLSTAAPKALLPKISASGNEHVQGDILIHAHDASNYNNSKVVAKTQSRASFALGGKIQKSFPPRDLTHSTDTSRITSRRPPPTESPSTTSKPPTPHAPILFSVHSSGAGEPSEGHQSRHEPPIAHFKTSIHFDKSKNAETAHPDSPLDSTLMATQTDKLPRRRGRKALPVNRGRDNSLNQPQVDKQAKSKIRAPKRKANDEILPIRKKNKNEVLGSSESTSCISDVKPMSEMAVEKNPGSQVFAASSKQPEVCSTRNSVLRSVNRTVVQNGTKQEFRNKPTISNVPSSSSDRTSISPASQKGVMTAFRQMKRDKQKQRLRLKTVSDDDDGKNMENSPPMNGFPPTVRCDTSKSTPTQLPGLVSDGAESSHAPTPSLQNSPTTPTNPATCNHSYYAGSGITPNPAQMLVRDYSQVALERVSAPISQNSQFDELGPFWHPYSTPYAQPVYGPTTPVLTQHNVNFQVSVATQYFNQISTFENDPFAPTAFDSGINFVAAPPNPSFGYENNSRNLAYYGEFGNAYSNHMLGVLEQAPDMKSLNPHYTTQ